MEPDNDTEMSSPEDILRAGMYRLLAGLASDPPGGEELAVLATLTGDETGLGQAVAALAALARTASPDAIAAEFGELIAPVTGAVSPFASHYVEETGALAELRRDMARHGIERDPDVEEPEDHLATLMEMMAGLIDGSFGVPLSLAEQKVLYERHLGSWAPTFFRELGSAAEAGFYSAVARVGGTFLQSEDEAFTLA